MKRRLIAPLPLLAILLTVVVLVLAYGVWQRQALASSSRQQAITVTQSVLSTGEASPLLERAHAELLAVRSAESLSSYIYAMPLTLGPLQQINSISGGIEAPLIPGLGLGPPPSASYELSLIFSQSAATAFIGLRRQGDTWQFTRFRVDAPLLYN